MRVLYPDYLLFNIVFQDWTSSRFSRERSTSIRNCGDAHGSGARQYVTAETITGM